MDSAGNIEWHRLTDIVRDTLSYENLEDLYHGLKLIEKDEGFEPWSSTTGIKRHGMVDTATCS